MLRRQLKLTAGDLDISTGNFQYMDPEESLTQRVSTRLKTFLGEVFTNQSLGVPYFQQIFAGKNPRASVLNAGFVNPIVALDGVLRVQRINYELAANRKLNVVLVVAGEDGTVVDLTEVLRV